MGLKGLATGLENLGLENLGLENLGLENLGLENLGGTLRHRSRLKWLQVIGRKSYD